MKSITKLISGITLLALVALVAVSCTRVEPGYVGIKVNQMGGNKGVEDYPLRTGLVWYMPYFTKVYEYPVFQQNVVWCKASTRESPDDDSITFNSIEGAVINADIALGFKFDQSKVPHLFVEFRQSPRELAHGYVKNEINNSFNRFASMMKATDIFGEKKQEILDLVRKDLNARLQPKGFEFTLISFHGGLRVDERVQSSINAVLEATQKAIEAENKVRQSKAEADQAIEKARGEKESNIARAEGEAKSITLKAESQAKANELIAQSLARNPMVLQSIAIDKWDGKLPYVNGSEALPFINVSTNR